MDVFQYAYTVFSVVLPFRNPSRLKRLPIRKYQYNPEFIKGFRQICKICISEYENDLKEKYDVNVCLIDDD